jgi:hypothetical protein
MLRNPRPNRVRAKSGSRYGPAEKSAVPNGVHAMITKMTVPRRIMGAMTLRRMGRLSPQANTIPSMNAGTGKSKKQLYSACVKQRDTR